MSNLIIFLVKLENIWSCSKENDITHFTKNCILTKTDLAFHQVKELWNVWDMLLGVLKSSQYFFLSKCAEMRLVIALLYFLSEAVSIFQKYIFQYVYPDLRRPSTKNTQNSFTWRIMRFEMWNTVAHIWDIIIAHQIYRIIFLDVVITFIYQNTNFNSKQYTIPVLQIRFFQLVTKAEL